MMNPRYQPQSRLLFQRPQSKAIPIVDPNSTEWPLLGSSKLPSSTIPAPLHAPSKTSRWTFNPLTNAERNLAIKPDEKSVPATGTGTGTGDEQVFEFDIYARPFVPETLTIINKLEGEKISTPPMKQVDFLAYASRHISIDFLPPIPFPAALPMNAGFNLTDVNAHIYYESYFRYLLQAEIVSQQRENESYSLYGHEVTLLPDVNGQTTCSFLVPGLKENSPYVEEDDLIQLRQIRSDHKGRPFGMVEWLTPSNQCDPTRPGFHALAGRWRGEPAPGWTGIGYNARVSAVQRKEERLVLKVCGLVDHNGGFAIQKAVDLKFNVQFPVPQERYLPMQQVLSVIQQALKHSNGRPSQYQDANGVSDAAGRTSSTGSSNSYESPQFNGLPEMRDGWLQSMLFPIPANCKLQKRLHPGFFKQLFFDDELNWEQKKTVESVCLQNYGNLPFLISGPPGTGKTKTMVEIALQLLKNVDKVEHILFVAPSDPAADTIVQRIRSFFNPNELLRLNRLSRTFAEVPGGVLPFCHISQDKFDLPPFKQLMSYRLVVTTCRDAKLLLYSRLTNRDLYAAEYGIRNSIHPYAHQPSPVELHWTALLMDESAQAIEPEALIPLSIVAPPLASAELAFTPLFVMAGDEHQLGPRTSLRITPLRISLFARLFSRPVYADHPLARDKTGKTPAAFNSSMLPIHRPAFANLIRNYRSHPAILAVPSSLFYADTLEPEATGIDRLSSWSEWQGRRWPVLLHSNSSEDEREMDSGGWYNTGEARIACRYAAHLVQSGLVEPKEVCIMTPFKAQVQCLRKTIHEKQYGSLWDVDIGPTEAFQGLERGVVILCTTRSKQRFVQSDKNVDWGIVGMPNKMNVALTRAKFGLIVIGKRDILLEDPNWKAFLEFCGRNGLVAGDGKVQDTGGEITRLEKVLLAKERDLVEDGDAERRLKVMSQEDEMWVYGMHGTSDAGSVSISESSEEGEKVEDDDDDDVWTGGMAQLSMEGGVNGFENGYPRYDDHE